MKAEQFFFHFSPCHPLFIWHYCLFQTLIHRHEKHLANTHLKALSVRVVWQQNKGEAPHQDGWASGSLPNHCVLFSVTAVAPMQTGGDRPPELHESCQRPSSLLRAIHTEQRMENVVPLPSAVGPGKAGPLLSHAPLSLQLMWLGLRQVREPNSPEPHFLRRDTGFGGGGGFDVWTAHGMSAHEGQTGVDRDERNHGVGDKGQWKYHQISPSGTTWLKAFSLGSCGFWGAYVKSNEILHYILI